MCEEVERVEVDCAWENTEDAAVEAVDAVEAFESVRTRATTGTLDCPW